MQERKLRQNFRKKTEATTEEKRQLHGQDAAGRLRELRCRCSVCAGIWILCTNMKNQSVLDAHIILILCEKIVEHVARMI